MSATATQAEHAAVQAAAAATAYEMAFAATVPPPVIAANRSLLISLIATNILGQNTAAIAATEAHYAEMWAQDAAAMYGYAGSSANATELTPFTAPPSTTNPAGPGAQAGANTQTTLSQLISAVPQALQGFASSAPTAATQAESPLLSLLDALSGPLSPVSLFGIGGIPYLLAIQGVLLPMNASNVIATLSRAEKMTAEGTWPPNPFDLGAPNPVEADAGARLVSSAAVGGTGTPVLAGLGNAGSVGRLSVPQGWSVAAPAVKPLAAALPGAAPEAAAALVAADSENGLLSELATGSLAGRAIGVTGGAGSRASGRGKRTAAKEAKPTTATIIVIPPSAED
jgi:PPE-repeat protein